MPALHPNVFFIVVMIVCPHKGTWQNPMPMMKDILGYNLKYEF